MKRILIAVLIVLMTATGALAIPPLPPGSSFNPAVPGTIGDRTPGIAYFTTVNGLTPTSLATGFSIAGGTTPETFTCDTNLTASTVMTLTGAQSASNKTLVSPVITGGSQTIAQVDGHAAVSSGSVATINTTPTNGGTGYAANDTGTITTGSGDATYKVLTVGGTGGSVVQTVALVDSGSSGYSVATGQATNKGGSQPGSGSGLTISVTAVGLTPAQVSNTYMYNTGQAASAVTNYLPTAKAGYGFVAYCGTAQTSQAWSFANNSGILNGASGDLVYFYGTAGTAGSSHGMQIVSPTVDAEMVCMTKLIGSAYYWSCKSGVGTWVQY